MWRKVGAINPTSNNDNKSNRSRDQNPIEQPFWQMTKQRMSESPIFFEGNDYFFNNHLSKVKDNQWINKTQQNSMRPNKLTIAGSLKQLSSGYKKNEVWKKKIDIQRIQKLEKILYEDNFGTSYEDAKTINGDDRIKTMQSTQKIQSYTSIDNNVKTLKQYRSTPQLNLPQIDPITEQVPSERKTQTKKSIETLRKQHSEIKEILQSELNGFSKELHLMQAEMSNKICRFMAENIPNSFGVFRQKEIKDNSQSRKLKCQQLIPETKKFAEKFRKLNAKKTELAQKYKSFRVK